MRVPMRMPQAPTVASDGQAPGRSSLPPPAETVVLGGGAKADAPPAAAAPTAAAAREQAGAERNEAPTVGGAKARQSERGDAASKQSVPTDAFAAADSAAANSAAAEAPPPESEERKQERQSSSSSDVGARSELREVVPQAASESFRDRAEADEHAREAGRQQTVAEPAASSPALSARLRKAAPSPTAKVGALAEPIVIRASNAVWVRVDGPVIERTTDAGRTWRTERHLEGTEIAGGVCPSADVCWLAGARGLVLRREPSGHWADVSPSGAGRVDRIEATDASHATLTATDGVRLTTTDGGRTWSPAR